MELKLSKVAKGIAFGDVSNATIRNILTQIGDQVYGKFTLQDLADTIDFFDGKCPYTGEDLETIEVATDHIVPQNREHCGLNVKGNLVLVSKKANGAKSGDTVEYFLLNDTKALGSTPMSVRQERLQKIKDFQKLCGYDPDTIKSKISPELNRIYDEIRLEQEKRISGLIDMLGLQRLTPVVATKVARTSSGNIKTELIFYPSDLNTFKTELLAKRKAVITLYYEYGKVDVKPWDASLFTVDSNLKGNIQSKPFWRSRISDGLYKVEVRV